MTKTKKKRGTSRKEIDEMLRGAHPDFQDDFREMMKSVEDTEVKGHNPSLSIEEIQQYRKELLSKIKAYPKGSFLQLDDYIDRVGVSYTYGYYPRTKPVLNVIWEEDSEMDDDNFLEALKGPLARLSVEVADINWTMCMVPFQEKYRSTIIRLMIFGVSREKLIELIEEDTEEVPSYAHDDLLQYNVLISLGQKLGSFLEEDGIPTSFPKRLSNKEMEIGNDLDYLLEGKKIEISIRFAGKDLVEYGYAQYIHENSESPIESKLAGSLVLHGLPPLLNVEIEDPDYSDVFTRPDLVIMADPVPLLIYADGAKYHETKTAQTHDKRVDRRLQELGFEILRVSGSDIYSNIERVVEDIKGRLFGRLAHILPEEFWKQKINDALDHAETPNDKAFLKSMLENVEHGRRVTVKQEGYLNKVCNRLGIKRTYEWLDCLKPKNFKY
jgi:hypothetical protein